MQKKKKKNVDSNILKAKSDKTKFSKFMKKQEAKGLLSSLGI